MRPMIEGDEEFKIKTLEALIVITYKSEEKFDTVLKYIGIIRQSHQNGMNGLIENSNPPVLTVEKSVYSSQKEWYASIIVHGSYQSKLYHDYLETIQTNFAPFDYSKEKAEPACIDYQIAFLEEINAEQQLIDYAKSKKR